MAAIKYKVGNTYQALTGAVQGPPGPQGIQGPQGPAGSNAWSDITGKPSTFTPSTHSHEQSDITGLSSALSGKAASSHTHTKSQITDFPAIPTVDSSLSSSSTNPVQNKVINTALNGKQSTISDLSTIRSNASHGESAYQMLDGVESLLAAI